MEGLKKQLFYGVEAQMGLEIVEFLVPRAEPRRIRPMARTPLLRRKKYLRNCGYNKI